MTLSALIRKREIATATVATPATQEGVKFLYSCGDLGVITPATHKGVKAGTVANVASVAVANQLLAEEETAIRAWLAHIEETDSVIIADVLARCQSDAQARAYCLEQARQVPPPPELDYMATCGACRHFQRFDHPNLGHCAQGEPEAIAGLWDTTRRWCMKYEDGDHD